MINIANLFSYAVVNRVDFLMVSSLVWAAMTIVVLLTRKPLFGLGIKGGYHESHRRLRVPLGKHRRRRARHRGRHRPRGARAVHRRGNRRGDRRRRPDRGGRAAVGLQPAHREHAQVSRQSVQTQAAGSLPSIDALLARGAAQGAGRAAAFETRIWWSPGSAAKTILGKLEAAGYQPAAKPQRFVVKGRYGPLRDGELERAKAWGAELAQAKSEIP